MWLAGRGTKKFVNNVRETATEPPYLLRFSTVKLVQQDLVKNSIINPMRLIGDSSWESLYPDINLEELTGSYLNEPEINQGQLDERNIKLFFEVMRELSQMLSNGHLFQIFVVLTLLDSEGLYHVGPFTAILKMRQMYLKLFQRKLNALGCSFIDYACFRKTLKKVKLFAQLLENFTGS